MTNVEADAAPPARAIGLFAIASGVASLVLLALHPEPAVKNFSELLKSEAAQRGLDAFVHGGYIAVLAVQIACYAAFSARVGRGRTAALAGITFFAIGAAFFSAALVLDGLAAPAVAARYAPQPDKIEFAHALYILMGSLVGVLQPMGVAFQAAAIAAWGWALVGNGARMFGAFALLLGAALLAAVGASVIFVNPLYLIAGMVGTMAWAMILGARMLRNA
jgi:hypothetical protein